MSVTAQFSPEERDALEKCALANGQSMSDFVRRQVLPRLRAEIDPETGRAYLG